jgi:hypothetical protein
VTADALPLSVGQQSLWLMHQLAPDSAAYNDVDAMRLAPVLDVAVLQRAVTALVERHDLLRPRFVETEDRVVRVLCPPGSVRVDVRDVPRATDSELLALSRQIGTAPFPLTETGPLRVVLLRRSTDAALVVATHHIASDALSQRIIWRDLAEAYRAGAVDSEPGWPALSATYHDFVAREQTLLDSPRRAEMEEYWQRVCAGACAATLPTDRLRPARSAFRGATRSVPLPEDLVRRVWATAAAAQVTPFTVLLAAFQVLLHRCSGQEDLMIGCPTTVRRTRVLRDMVGLLVNTIVVRARFAPDTTVAAAIEQARQQLVDGMSRVSYPLALLNSARADREPLYRIAITMVKPPLGDTIPPTDSGPFELFPGHQSHRLDIPRLEGQFDLTAEITQMPNSMAAVFRYDTELFDQATIDRLLRLYLQVISAACANPTVRVSRLSMVDDAERRRLLALGSA